MLYFLVCRSLDIFAPWPRILGANETCCRLYPTHRVALHCWCRLRMLNPVYLSGYPFLAFDPWLTTHQNDDPHSVTPPVFLHSSSLMWWNVDRPRSTERRHGRTILFSDSRPSWLAQADIKEMWLWDMAWSSWIYLYWEVVWRLCRPLLTFCWSNVRHFLTAAVADINDSIRPKRKRFRVSLNNNSQNRSEFSIFTYSLVHLGQPMPRSTMAGQAGSWFVR